MTLSHLSLNPIISSLDGRCSGNRDDPQKEQIDPRVLEMIPAKNPTKMVHSHSLQYAATPVLYIVG